MVFVRVLQTTRLWLKHFHQEIKRPRKRQYQTFTAGHRIDAPNPIVRRILFLQKTAMSTGIAIARPQFIQPRHVQRQNKTPVARDCICGSLKYLFFLRVELVDTRDKTILETIVPMKSTLRAWSPLR
ncbi:hypothetical protein D3260_10460 [Salinisphaera sp. Q1T1-3]|nr:hypothetical protein D3260_10460 [Salinisphaera sp. Q1T1-3]